MSSRSVRWFATVAAAVVVAGCSSAQDEAVSSSDEAVVIPASLCGKAAMTTIDDIPAYPNNCGNVNVWSNDGRTTQTHAGTGTGWVQTEGGYGYQCTELASRYMHFRFGTATHWGIAEAKDMCATHPADLSKTSSPVEGDLMVFAPNVCVGGAGHVAVVSSATSTTASVVQQNETSTGKGTYKRSCALCFLHAARNNVCGDAADGSYCGDASGLIGGAKGTLYVCKGHAVASSTVCADGCETDAGACAPAASAEGGTGDAPDAAAKSDSRAPENDARVTPNAGAGGCATAPLASANRLDRRAMVLSVLGLFVIVRRRRARLS